MIGALIGRSLAGAIIMGGIVVPFDLMPPPEGQPILPLRPATSGTKRT